MNSLHFLFAWRYFKAKKSTNAINVISWISIAAIIVGTTALIMVLSVFNGFEDIVKSLYSSFYTDLRISPEKAKVMQVTPAQLEQLRAVKGIRNYSLTIEEKAFLKNGESMSAVYLKGVDANYRYVSGVANNLVRNAKYDLGSDTAPRIILGAGIEGAIGVIADVNEVPLQIYLPRKTGREQLDEEGIASSPIYTSATFRIQQDFDNKYAITNIDFVRAATLLPKDTYSTVEIVIQDPAETNAIRKKVAAIFGNGYKVQNKYEQNQSLYAVMNMERWVIYGVLCLILVIAAFNMIGALTMLVLEKQKDISVLHALGATPAFIRRVFLTEGMLLAIIGGVAGMLLALLLSWLQLQFHLVPLAGGSFLINYFPVKLRVMDFLLVGATVFVIALLASWFPSRKATSLKNVLNYES